MFYLLLILAAVAGIPIVLFGAWREAKGWHKGGLDFDNGMSATGIIIGIICLLTVIIAYPCSYFSNLNKRATLEAFYNYSISNYEYTCHETESDLSVDPQGNYLIEGNIEKAELATAASERIAEYRDSANEYNYALAKYKIMDNNLWFGLAYPPLPEYIKPIVIGKKAQAES